MLPAQFLQDNPRLYQLQKHTAFDPLIFAGWIFRAFLHAIIIFFIPYAAFGVENISQSDGSADGLWFFSTVVYYATVMVPTLLIMYDMANITFLHWVSIACSVASLFVVTLIMSYMTSLVPDLAGLVPLMYGSAMFWLILIITVGSCMVCELIWRAAMRELYPSVVQIFQEIQRMSPADQKAALDPALLVAPQPTPAPQPRAGSASAPVHSGGAPPTSDDNIHIEYSQSVAGNTRGGGGMSPSVGGLQRRNSLSQQNSARGRDKLKQNMVRAMLRFRVRKQTMQHNEAQRSAAHLGAARQ